MSKEVSDAIFEMGFVGHYLVQHAAIARWSSDKNDALYHMKELLTFAERIKDAAETIRNNLEERERI